jgi:F-type H+-transporting ATPase subunit delta
MSAYAIATRYAKSLLSLALEMKKLDDVYEDMTGLQAAINGSRELELMLKSPIIKEDKKTQIMEMIFEKEMSEMTMEFCRIVIRKKREGALPKIAESFVTLYNKDQGITNVTLTTAVKVDDSIKDLINKLVKKATKSSEINLEAHVDKDILGGFVLKYEDKQYDASVANQLDDLQTEFKKNTYIKKF